VFQSKIERLVKRFFQMKAMKQIADLGDSRTPAMIEVAPILESESRL